MKVKERKKLSPGAMELHGEEYTADIFREVLETKLPNSFAKYKRRLEICGK